MRCLKVLACALLTLPAAIGFAQGIADLIKSAPVPEVIAIDALPGDFKAVTLKLSSSDSYMSAIGLMSSPIFNMGDVARGGPDAAVMMDMVQTSWTNGQTLKTEVGEFLVTYRLGLDTASPGESKITAASVRLRLTMVRKDSIIEIAPRPDLTKNRLLETFAPVRSSQSTTRAKKAEALSSMKQLVLATIMYQTDYDDVCPYVQDTKSVFAVIMPYLKNNSIYRSLNPSPGSRILYNMAISGVAGGDIPQPADTVLFYDSATWPDGTRIVGFMDGHARDLSPDEWQKAERTLHLKLKRSGKPLPPNYWRKIAPGGDFGDGPAIPPEGHPVPKPKGSGTP